MLGNAGSARLNPGDVLKVSMTDPTGGFTAKVADLTTGRTGFIQASAKNGFANTNMSDCSGNPFTWHAEYSTAKKQNQVPWAALEGGVLMEQEIGHGESCARLTGKQKLSASFSDGSSYTDPNVYQTCGGGMEGRGKKGEGPCNLTKGACKNSGDRGAARPRPVHGGHVQACEFSDGFCLPKGTRPVTISGHPGKEYERVSTCDQNQFENGDLDFDGTGYRKDWPNGSGRFPQTFRYLGPFTNGHAYPQIQFETDIAGSENLCNVATGVGCKAPPIGSAGFYPFWSLTNKQQLKGVSGRGVCVWNFGNDIAGVTTHNFGGDAEYGVPDTARYGGTIDKRRPWPTRRRGRAAKTTPDPSGGRRHFNCVQLINSCAQSRLVGLYLTGVAGGSCSRGGVDAPTLARKPARGNWIWLGGALCAVVVLAGIAVGAAIGGPAGSRTRAAAQSPGGAPEPSGPGAAQGSGGPPDRRATGRPGSGGYLAGTPAVAVFYDPGDALGSCSLGPFPPGGRYVSLPPERFGRSAACGSYLTVQGPRGQVRAEVVDLCPGCATNMINLSRAAFTRIADPGPGSARVRFWPVDDPPLPGPLILRTGQTSAGLPTLQVRRSNT